MSLPDIVKRIDNDARTLSSSIEMSEEQILLKVEDTAQGLRSFIAVTKEQILAEAEDLKRELKGLLAVQAGAVKAMVEGGGAAGQLALSLELPAMIDKKTFNKFVEKCGGEATAKVYARLAETDYYAIRGDISGKPVKALWDKAVKAGLLASQIQLNADQIVVQNGDKVAAAFVDGKLRAACIDAENLIVQQLKIDSDKQSNQDFEAYFDKNRGLQIRNKGADILKIDPKTGEAFFTGKVDFSGSTHIGGNANIDGNTVIEGNTIIGNNCVVHGNIEAGPLILNNETEKANFYTFSTWTQDIVNQIKTLINDLSTGFLSMAFFGNIEFTYGDTWAYKYSASLILYNKGKLVYNKTLNYGSLPYTLSFYKGVPAGS